MRNGSGLLVILGYSPPHTQTGDQENQTVERVSWNVCNSEPIMISNGMSGYALINLLLFVRKKWMMLYLGRETPSLFVVVQLWFRFVEYRAEKN